MSSLTVSTCVSVLVLLCLHSCDSRPHSASKRAIIDYIKPALFSPIEFEKGDDGKLYLKKNFHKRDSTVNYIEISEPIDKDMKMVEDEASKTANIDAKSEPGKETISRSSSNIGEVKEEEKTVDDKAKIETGKAPYIPVDKKLLVAPKPDSKDEIAEPTVLPPAGKDGKVAIGEVPPTDTRIVPLPDSFRIPVLIPVRQISFGTVSILPLPPVSGSDRLPIPYDDEIVGEGGHESEPLEEGEDKETGLPLGDPYAPALPFTGSFLKDLKEAADEQDAERKTKIVDVLGKKFVMQSNIIKYPRGDLGHTFVRFMSIKPLEEEDSKAAEAEKKQQDSELEKDIEKMEILAQDEKSITKAKTIAKEREFEKEPLKAEESLAKVQTESPEKAEDSFKEYEDPYLKGIEEMHKKLSFEAAIGEDRGKGEEKMDESVENSPDEGSIAGKEKISENDQDATVVKDTKKVGSEHKETANKKECGKAKEKVEKKKRKCKCEESDSVGEE